MLLLASGIGLFSCAEKDLPKEYTDSVNVFIGTGGHGHTFPGATLPHGMVQLIVFEFLASPGGKLDFLTSGTSEPIGKKA